MGREASIITIPTPLWAVAGLTFLASIGTGVVWNGVAFVAKHEYGFQKHETLLLYLVLGAVYVAGALSTGRVLRRLEAWLSPRAALGLILLTEAVVCAALWLSEGRWMLWVVACAISVLSSWLWPIVESYLTAGRHGAAMRSAIGWWNLSWTGAVALALVLMAPLLKAEPLVVEIGGRPIALEPRLAIVILGALHAVALLFLPWFNRVPGAHDAAHWQASMTPEYPLLLRAARMLLPLSYVLNAAMAPLLPYWFDRVNLAPIWETPVASTWMWVRIVAMGLMWQVGFWHGRWGTLLAGGVAMAVGFAMVLGAPALWLMIAGLGVFGAGMGIVYYAALYYAMSVGRAEVDAGGTHEALIGVGYAVGPGAGLLGLGAAETAKTAGIDLWDGAGVIAVVWLLIGASAVGVAQPYFKARRMRQPSQPSTTADSAMGTRPRR